VSHVSRPHSGKSVICVNILINENFNVLKHLDHVYVFSPTCKDDDTWRYVINRENVTIHDTYSDEILQKIVDNNKEEKLNIGIIYDDYMTMKNIKANSLCFSLASNYRHSGIKLMYYISQKMTSMPRVLRLCIDYLLLSKTTNEKELEYIMNEYGCLYEGQLKNMIKKATEKKYGFLFLKLAEDPPEAYINFTKKIEYKKK
jgi:hypothetical protein